MINEKDKLKQDESKPESERHKEPNAKIGESEEVRKIREFFDSKTEYLKIDKLSQAHILSEFQEQDVIDLNVKDLDTLKLMFQAYCQNPNFTPSLELPKEWWKFLGLWDGENRKNLWFWINKKPSTTIRSHVTRIILQYGFIAALVQYAFSLPGVERQKYLQAWQVINTANAQTGSGGRIEALEYLNKEKQFLFTPKCREDKNNCLVGIKIQGANLKGVNLESANLTSSELQGTNFEGANLENADFTDANLEGVVFKRAKMGGVVFSKKTSFCNTTMADGKVEKPECKYVLK
jgi:Pentapeptide repeats (8 copies)